MKAIEILTDESIAKIEHAVNLLEAYYEVDKYKTEQAFIEDRIAEVRELLNELKESNK